MAVFPESWSAEENLSSIIAFGGVISTVFVVSAALRILWFTDRQIDVTAANLLTLAGILGMATLTFAVWMCWRRIGFPGFRYSALVLSIIGVSSWPVMNSLFGS
jgi:hypothetical protein